MRNFAVTALTLACAVGGCAGRHIESGVVLPPRTTARLDVVGAHPRITIRNEGAVAVPVAIGWGQAGKDADTLEPGVARWWNPDGPRSFWLMNRAERPVAMTYVIDNADVNFVMPAAEP